MSGTLPAWIERLLGIDAQRGEGTAWSLQHSWPWPPWVTLIFVVLAVVVIVAVYLREGRQAGRPYRIMLAGIRLALVAVVLAMIAQYTLSLHRTGLPYVAVLVDNSSSMTVIDRYQEKVRKQLQTRLQAADADPEDLSRWNLARTLLGERDAALLRGIQNHYKLRLYLLEDSAAGVGQGYSGEIDVLLRALVSAEEPIVSSTRLGAAVGSVLDELRGAVPAAIVLLSDGINTDGPPLAAAAAAARRRGVPMFTVGIGSDEPLRDLKLSDLLVDDVVFLNDVVHFELRLTATGFENDEVTVLLREQGKQEVLTQMDVRIGPDGQPLQIRLPYRPTEAGQFQYVVEVEPQPGELQTDNNRQQRSVEVRKEQIRVLLAQAYPNWEFRYLRNMLSRDETIELQWVLQDADLQYTQRDPAALGVFPVRRDDLFSYDVIILGDLDPALLSASTLQNLADFVDQPGKGGALMLICGPRYMPLAYRGTPLQRLMPVELASVQAPDPNQAATEGFLVRPTELGLAGPAMQLGDTPRETRTIWENLPPLYWLLSVHELKPAARTLAEHPTRLDHEGRHLPVICMQYVGAGKVVLHATDETWRWRRRIGDLYFARYWVQMIRYLSRSTLGSAGRSVDLSTDQREYAQGDTVRLRVQFADERQAPAEDDGVTVVLQRAGRKRQQLGFHRRAASRGTFEAAVGALPAGSYHAWLARPTPQGRAPTVDFSVLSPPGEFERVRMDTAALRQAARQTEGRFYTFQTADRLLRQLPPGRQVPIESLPPKPLWNKWPLLLLFLVLIVTEWTLRKRGGMV